VFYEVSHASSFAEMRRAVCQRQLSFLSQNYIWWYSGSRYVTVRVRVGPRVGVIVRWDTVILRMRGCVIFHHRRHHDHQVARLWQSIAVSTS